MNAHKLTEGAVLLAIYLVILLMTMYIPFIGIILNFFLALPFIIFSAKNQRKNIFLFVLGALILSFITGGLLGIFFTLFLGFTGSVIGDFIREKKSKMAGFIAGSFAFLIVLIVQYTLAVTFFEINFIKDMMQELEQGFMQALNSVNLPDGVSSEEITEQLILSLELVETLIPSIFVMVSFFYVLMVEVISFPIAARFVDNVPKWKPFRELVLPRSLLWYYLIVLLLSMFINIETGSYWYAVIVNLSYILQIFMMLQGLSLIYNFFYKKKQPKSIPILITIMVFVLPFLMLPLVRILGIIDLGFNLRDKLKEKD